MEYAIQRKEHVFSRIIKTLLALPLAITFIVITLGITLPSFLITSASDSPDGTAGNIGAMIGIFLFLAITYGVLLYPAKLLTKRRSVTLTKSGLLSLNFDEGAEYLFTGIIALIAGGLLAAWVLNTFSVSFTNELEHLGDNLNNKIIWHIDSIKLLDQSAYRTDTTTLAIAVAFALAGFSGFILAIIQMREGVSYIFDPNSDRVILIAPGKSTQQLSPDHAKIILEPDPNLDDGGSKLYFVNLNILINNKLVPLNHPAFRKIDLKGFSKIRYHNSHRFQYALSRLSNLTGLSTTSVLNNSLRYYKDNDKSRIQYLQELYR